MPGGSPENFTAIGLTSTSVQLKWDAPARNLRHGDIVLYEVVYHRADNTLEDFAVNATDTSVIVEGLDVDTDYIFQLRAYTVKGSGPWTSRLPYKTFANREYILVRLRGQCMAVNQSIGFFHRPISLLSLPQLIPILYM